MDYSGVTLETTSWEDAWKHVRDILPEAVYMTPGSLSAVAEKIGRSITVTHLANSPASSNNATALRSASQANFIAVRFSRNGVKP